MESKINILIADDNVQFTRDLQRKLSEVKNFNVVGIAGSGIDAIKLIEELKPDVVLLDIVMLNVDGLEVLEKVKANKRKKPIFIVVSALCQENIISRATILGARYYIIKPFEIDILIKRINELVSDNFSIKNENEYMKTLEALVIKKLHKLGIPAHILGYRLLKDAIIMAEKDINVISHVTKNLYPDLAKKYKITIKRVETSMRYAIDISWKSGKLKSCDDIFGYELSKKPSIRVFLSNIIENIKLELK